MREQFGNARCEQDGAHRNLYVEGPANHIGQLEGDERITAEVEEVIVEVDFLEAKYRTERVG
ncbi:MAG TPA: hypothetical protein VN767_14420 [Streptosporangiaceae bacterium]|nr:hypothetical protein [Streptosporangiaceae bacterium]